MVIYVLRHGESTANAEKIFAGWAQVPLTGKGMEQARQARPLLQDIPFTKVIASDLLRAVQTAQEALPGYEVHTDPRLREIHGGALQGRALAEFSPEFWAKRDYTAYGGENLTQHIARVSQFMDSLQNEPEDAKIAVVCHAGTIHGMLCHVLQTHVPQNAATALNGAVSVFSCRNGHWSLCKWNETGSANIPE